MLGTLLALTPLEAKFVTIGSWLLVIFVVSFFLLFIMAAIFAPPPKNDSSGLDILLGRNRFIIPDHLEIKITVKDVEDKEKVKELKEKKMELKEKEMELKEKAMELKEKAMELKDQKEQGDAENAHDAPEPSSEPEPER